MCIFREKKDLCISPESSEPGSTPASMGKSGEPDQNSYDWLIHYWSDVNYHHHHITITITRSDIAYSQELIDPTITITTIATIFTVITMIRHHLLSRTRAAASLRQLRTGNPKSSQARSSPAGHPPNHHINEIRIRIGTKDRYEGLFWSTQPVVSGCGKPKPCSKLCT